MWQKAALCRDLSVIQKELICIQNKDMNKDGTTFIQSEHKKCELYM